MKLERNRMVEVLFYTAVLTKQFYLLPSGSIGIADLFFALSGALALIMAWRSGKKIWYQEDFPWVVFLIFAAVINGIYFVRTGKGSFPLHTLYWIYSAFLIWAFRTLIRIRLCGDFAGYVGSIWCFRQLF
jgi:phosphoglycerol transferase MdoB-like AlkP superfamily enzyme